MAGLLSINCSGRQAFQKRLRQAQLLFFAPAAYSVNFLRDKFSKRGVLQPPNALGEEGDDEAIICRRDFLAETVSAATF